MLWGRRVLEPLKAMQTMVLVLVVLLLVFRLGGLVAHLRFQVAVLGKVLVGLCFCGVDNGRRIALLHHGVLLLWGSLYVVHHEGCSGTTQVLLSRLISSRSRGRPTEQMQAGYTRIDRWCATVHLITLE